MKTIALISLTLVAALSVFGTVVVVSANRTGALAVQRQALVTPSPVPFTPPVVATPTAPSLAPIFSQGSPQLPEIAFTFDDGPNPTYTPQVLHALEHYGVHATFFTIGLQVQRFPALVQEEVGDGDGVGNHTWDHPDLTTLPPEAVYIELSHTSLLVTQTTGIRPTLFRPPYGAITPEVHLLAAQLGMTSTLWSIDTQDWQRPGTQTIVNRVLSHVTNGSIILMHDGGGNRSQTVAALATIIPALQARGFQLVTVAQLAHDAQTVSTVSAPQAQLTRRGGLVTTEVKHIEQWLNRRQHGVSTRALSMPHTLPRTWPLSSVRQGHRPADM